MWKHRDEINLDVVIGTRIVEGKNGLTFNSTLTKGIYGL